jgi:hypothetical protein
MRRTSSIGRSFGSSSGQSSRRRPGTYGHSSPQPIVIRSEPRASSSVSVLGPLRAQIDANFAHHMDDLAVHPFAGLSAGRNHLCAGRIGKRPEERRRHL